jgi:hypothetical protein
MTASDGRNDWSAEVEKLVAEIGNLPDAPEWIGQVGDGVLEGALPAQSVVDAGRGETYGEQARALSLLCNEQDAVLEPRARTGRLIRVLVQTDAGVAAVMSIVPEQHFVGFQSGLSIEREYDAVKPIDHTMISLVDARREQLGLPSLDQGGEKGRKRRSTEESERGPDSVRTGEDPFPEGVAELYEAVRGVVDHKVVHWAALARAERSLPVFALDQLAHPALVGMHERISPAARRAFYATYAGGVHALVNRFGRAVRPVIGGPVRSLVLDVESGAIAVHRLTGDVPSYLLGLTLFQTEVQALEARLAALGWRAALR